MTLWVGTSWKMTKTLAEATAYARALAAAASRDEWPGVQPFVVPPFTALHQVARTLSGTGVTVGAQNAHWEDEGAWTGEISVAQAADAGATLIEIGHSERRQHFGETDETVARKLAATLRHGLTPLLCVGEPDDVFRRGGSARHVVDQVEAALHGLPHEGRADVLVAYEPVWAIGEQGRPARPEDLAATFSTLHTEFGQQVRGLLYGGSVSEDNAMDILDIPRVDGLFVGRAAWAVEGYLRILDRVGGRGQLGGRGPAAREADGRT